MEKLSRKFVKLHYPLTIAGWAFIARPDDLRNGAGRGEDDLKTVLSFRF